MPVFRGSPNFGILGYPEYILNLGYPGIILSCISALGLLQYEYRYSLAVSGTRTSTTLILHYCTRTMSTVPPLRVQYSYSIASRPCRTSTSTSIVPVPYICIAVL